MSDSLAPLSKLESRLPEPLETEQEIALAEEMLSDASAEARLYGNQLWTVDTVPSGVVNIILKAAARGYMNPAGFESEAADGTRFGRRPEYAMGTTFTRAEINAVRGFAKRSGISYTPATKPNGWQALSDYTRGGTLYVPMVHHFGAPYPWLQEGDHPQ